MNIWNISADDLEPDEVTEARLNAMMDDFLNDDSDEFDHIDWQGWHD